MKIPTRLITGCAALILSLSAVMLSFHQNTAGIPNLNGAPPFAADFSSELLPKPADGTPAQFTPEENLFIAMHVFRSIPSLRSETAGTVSADVFFINYQQRVRNVRVIQEHEMTTEAVSVSLLKKVGERIVFRENEIRRYRALSVDENGAVWTETPDMLTDSMYEEAYGLSPRNLTNYVLNRETILSAAPAVASSLEGTADAVPGQELFTYQYELEPQRGTVFYKRQVRSVSGASEDPVFYSVKLILTIDSEWRPVFLRIYERYDIQLPVIGNVSCNAELFQTFLYESP